MRKNGTAMSDAFESKFEEYLESDAYEDAEGVLFSAVRAAYKAGWKAAGGESLPVLELLPLQPEQMQTN